MKLSAYAKVNLTLDILDKRKDGYHNIDSVMQTVELCDIITAEKSEKTSLYCDDNSIKNEENTVLKAAEKFFSFTGINGGVSIEIEKHIPLCAGLGGGSADAAAVIKLLDKMYETNLTDEELIKIAVSVGADVPFCLYGNTARVRGIGEEITRLKSIKGYGVLLIKNSEKSSTAEMYRIIDGYKERTPMTEKFIEELTGNSFEFTYTGNDFLAASDVGKVLEDIKEYRPLCVSLSGSGPTVFAVFKDTKTAADVADSLKEKGYSPIITSFI